MFISLVLLFHTIWWEGGTNGPRSKVGSNFGQVHKAGMAGKFPSCTKKKEKNSLKALMKSYIVICH